MRLDVWVLADSEAMVLFQDTQAREMGALWGEATTTAGLLPQPSHSRLHLLCTQQVHTRALPGLVVPLLFGDIETVCSRDRLLISYFHFLRAKITGVSHRT